MNRQAFFCKHLSSWLYNTDWHFTTLIGITIECVRDLPDDADQLIHDLLRRHPTRSTQREIEQYLRQSDRLQNWFMQARKPPQLSRFNLDSEDLAALKDDRLPQLNSSKELANWLGLSETHLEWLADLWRSEGRAQERLLHYRYQLLEKRHGDYRVIEMPKGVLREAQRKIHRDVLRYAEVHVAAHGFRAGRNCQSHAAIHVGRHYLFMFDLADCFHSVDWSRVRAVFKDLGYQSVVAKYLTALCTHKTQLDRTALTCLTQTQQRLLNQRHLPQGAPSSPSLANAALRRLDNRLLGLAKSLNLNYSRYADDLALSGDTHRDWRFLEPAVGAICLEEGFNLNFRKTKIKRPHQKQKLTGVVVNQKTNIDRDYFDRLKAILTNCVRHGLESQNRTNHVHFRQHLLGCVQHVKSLNSRKGAKLERLYEKIEGVQAN